jgi:hypothetical protein
MADNVTFQAVTTATPPNATTVAADDVGGVKFQQVKLDIGGDGVSSPLTTTNPMPVAGSVQTVGTSQVLGSVQGVGTFQALGTFQPLAGSVHLASGTVQVLGSIQSLAGSVHLANTFPGGTIHIGTIAGTISVGTVAGTISALGTFQPLAGSVHLANTFPGGTIHIGTIAGTVSVGTIAGTVSALGTFQPLAGSVHLATSLAGGTIVAVGSAAHAAAADTRPLLMGGFGSSGTQVAVSDGNAVRLWADLNGRLQVRGTIDSLPAVVITSGTVGLAGGTQHIGSVQRITGGTIDFIGGTVNIGTLQGTIHIGSVQRLTGGTVDFIGGTVNIGTLQGTIHIGSVQRLGGGTIDQLNGTVRGTVSIAGTAPLGTLPGGTVVALPGGFGSYFGTSFTANATLGTLIAPPASGTRWRLHDLTISASAAGTVLLQEAATAANGTVVFGPLFFAANGGMVQASARGLPARVTAQGLFCSVSAGTVSVTVNYGLET